MILTVCCVFDVVALALGAWLVWRRPFRGVWRDAVGLLCLAALAVLELGGT